MLNIFEVYCDSSEHWYSFDTGIHHMSDLIFSIYGEYA